MFLERTTVSKGALGPSNAKVSVIVNVTLQKANIAQPKRGESFPPELRFLQQSSTLKRFCLISRLHGLLYKCP